MMKSDVTYIYLNQQDVEQALKNYVIIHNPHHAEEINNSRVTCTNSWNFTVSFENEEI